MMHGYGLGYGWLFQLLIICLLIFVFWWLLRAQTFGYGQSPKEIVKRRYAAGEITKKEYDKIMKDL